MEDQDLMDSQAPQDLRVHRVSEDPRVRQAATDNAASLDPRVRPASAENQDLRFVKKSYFLALRKLSAQKHDTHTQELRSDTSSVQFQV